MPNKNKREVDDLKNNLKAELKKHCLQLLTEGMYIFKRHTSAYLQYAAENCFDYFIVYLNNKISTTSEER